MRTTPLILALTLALGACGRPETGDTGCDTDCADTDTAVDTGCDGCVDPNDPDGDGVTQDDGDCAPTDATVFPGAPELLDTIDNDCDTVIDEGTVAFDDDNDSYTEEEGDCDDNQPAVNPMATDLVGDGIDQNCDEVDGTDADGDGHASEVTGGDDCDDIDFETFTGAFEIWYDGVDQGCVGDEWPGDSDQDGDGFDVDVLGGTDCNDIDTAVNPEVIETNDDDQDNNCNGLTNAWTFHIAWNPDFNCAPGPSCSSPEVVFTLSATDQTYVPSLSGNVLELSAFDSTTSANGDVLFPISPDGTAGDLVAAGDWGVTAPTATTTWKLKLRNLDECIVWGDDEDLLDPEGACLRYDPTTP